MISRAVYELLRFKVEKGGRYPDTCDDEFRIFLEQEILHYASEGADPGVLYTMKLALEIFYDCKSASVTIERLGANF